MTRERQLENGASRETTDSTAKLHEGTTPRRILTYHEVEPEKSTYIYAVTSQQLDEQLTAGRGTEQTRARQHGIDIR